MGYRKIAKSEMMGMTTVFNASGVDKENFVKYTEENPATYRDWSRTWDQETTGKDDDLKSPYLDREFEEARARGVIPPETSNIGGSWTALMLKTSREQRWRAESSQCMPCRR